MARKRVRKTLYVFFCPTVAPGPVVSFGQKLYREFAPGIIALNYPRLGLDRLEANYQFLDQRMEEVLAEATSDGTALKNIDLVIIAWSQGSIHGLRYALRHPGLVKRLILMAGPMSGSKLAYLLGGIPHFRKYFPRRFPFIGPVSALLRGFDAFHDMTPSADHTKELRAEIESAVSTLAGTEVFVIAVARDRLVHPHATLLPPNDNIHVIWVSRSRPVEIPAGLDLHWVPIRDWLEDISLNHLTVGLHPRIVPLVDMACNGRLLQWLRERALDREVASAEPDVSAAPAAV